MAAVANCVVCGRANFELRVHECWRWEKAGDSFLCYNHHLHKYQDPSFQVALGSYPLDRLPIDSLHSYLGLIPAFAAAGEAVEEDTAEEETAEESAEEKAEVVQHQDCWERLHHDRSRKWNSWAWHSCDQQNEFRRDTGNLYSVHRCSVPDLQRMAYFCRRNSYVYLMDDWVATYLTSSLPIKLMLEYDANMKRKL